MTKCKFRNIKVIIIIIVLIIISFVFISTPKSVVSHPENTQICRAIYEEDDITSQINKKALIDYLSDIKCKRTFERFSPMLSSDIAIEIDFVDNGKLLHLILGNINIRYESANKNGYIIINSDEVFKKIQGMIVK